MSLFLVGTLCRSTFTCRTFGATPNNALIWKICLPKLPCPCIYVEQSCPTQCEQSDAIFFHDTLWWCTTWTKAKQTHIVGLHGATWRCIAYLLQTSCPTAAHRLDVLPTTLKRPKCAWSLVGVVFHNAEVLIFDPLPISLGGLRSTRACIKRHRTPCLDQSLIF